jgi:hypothetical protein
MYQEQRNSHAPLLAFILPLHHQFGCGQLVFTLHKLTGIQTFGKAHQVEFHQTLARCQT